MGMVTVRRCHACDAITAIDGQCRKCGAWPDADLEEIGKPEAIRRPFGYVIEPPSGVPMFTFFKSEAASWKASGHKVTEVFEALRGDER